MIVLCLSAHGIKKKVLMNGPMICKHDKFKGLSKGFETFQIVLDC
jgi:hypothetical protein